MILRGDSVLLVERGREPLRGHWSLPGGVLEVGGLLEDAIRREVREETGLDVEPLAVVEVFQWIIPGQENKPEYHYVIIDYLCAVQGGELRAASDVSRAAWVRRDEFSRYLITEGATSVIEKGFRKRDELK